MIIYVYVNIDIDIIIGTNIFIDGYYFFSYEILLTLFITSLQSRYRLDTMVNRVTFDRMVAALQVFSQPGGDQPPVSPAIRELLLYSYPNSIIQVLQN